ncbi:MAG: site-specific DNA-methyltransferase [Salinivirgaceae bacterium]|nr:site-specific DNA-methyltransferase [Salinivirgaceae bacterium]
MPTLNWIGKDAVVNHHLQVPFRTLEKKYTFGDADSDNMIIHGDNLEALKALMPKYEGKIKCIYIDPPYNTGASPDKGGWVYYDNVDSPKIQKWLHDVFHKTGVTLEDLARHDKWLCMMYPRLKLLHKLLSDNGVIFISIDDNEQANLKLICDEIFGVGNYVGCVAVENNPKGRKNSNFFSTCNDYLIVYTKSKSNSKFIENIPKAKKDLKMDESGLFVHNSGKRVLVGENKFNEIVTNYKSPKHYSIYYNKDVDDIIFIQEMDVNEIDESLINDGYIRYYSHNEGHFVLNTYTMERMQELFDDDLLDFKEDKIYEKNISTTIRAKTILVNKRYKAVINNNVVDFEIDVKTTSANTCLKNIFSKSKSPFTNPKNVGLLHFIITLFEEKDITILDSFSGSGTTAHAVLNLNKQDGGNRKFILVEMEDYAETITAERVRRVINGYGKDKNAVEGTGGGFTFYELGETVFDADGYLNETIGVEKLREYIWYSETHEPYVGLSYNGSRNDNDGRLPQCDSPTNVYLLGNHNGSAYYFYYEPNRTTTLDKAFLNTISQKAEQYVIYADNCLLSESFMQLNHIVFKKIPRDIRKF